MVPVKSWSWQFLLMCREAFPGKILWCLWLSVTVHRPLALYVMLLSWRKVPPLYLAKPHSHFPILGVTLRAGQCLQSSRAHSDLAKSLLTSPPKVVPAVQDHLPSTIVRKREVSLLTTEVSFISARIPSKLMRILLELEGKELIFFFLR